MQAALAAATAMADRMLAGSSASLKAKLTEMSRYLPSAAMRKRMPAGSGTIGSVPPRSACASAEEWRRAVRATAKVFARCQITQGTRIEHEKYVVWVNTYAEIHGHRVRCRQSRGACHLMPVAPQGGHFREGRVRRSCHLVVCELICDAMCGARCCTEGTRDGWLRRARQG